MLLLIVGCTVSGVASRITLDPETVTIELPEGACGAGGGSSFGLGATDATSAVGVTLTPVGGMSGEEPIDAAVESPLLDVVPFAQDVTIAAGGTAGLDLLAPWACVPDRTLDPGEHEFTAVWSIGGQESLRVPVVVVVPG